MLAISTDMQTPKDIDVVSLYVTTDGAPKFDYLGRVRPDGTVSLPSTLAIVEPDDPNAQVRIRIIAFQAQGTGENARVLRDVLTTVPHGRTALLRIPLNFIDDGSGTGTIPAPLVPGKANGVLDGTSTFDPTTVQSKCDFAGDMQTVIDGACASAQIDSSTLPDYGEAAVYGDGGTPDAPSCFDVAACFANAVPVQPVPASGGACGFALPQGTDGSTLNVALATASTGTPVGGVDLVPLENDPDEGFVVNGTTVTLAPGVCAQLVAAGTSVVVSNACAPKVEAAPVCEPAARTEDAGGPPVDAATMPDATVSDAPATDSGGSDASTPDATTNDGAIATEASSSDGGAPVDAATPPMVLFAVGPASAYGAQYVGGAWTPVTPLGAAYSAAGGGVSYLADGRALGVARLGTTYQAQASLFAGAWSPLTNVGGATTGNSVAAPFATATSAFFAKLDTSGTVFLETFGLASSAWTEQNTGATMTDNNGETVAAATMAGDPVVIMPNSSAPYTFTTYDGTTWSAPAPVAGVAGPPACGIQCGPAAAAALRVGVDEIVAVFEVASDAGPYVALQPAVYSGSTWTAGSVLSTDVQGLSEGSSMSLTALADGRVALAYADNAAGIEVAFYDGTAWSALQTAPATVATSTGAGHPVSVTRGVGGDVLELAYVRQTDGYLGHIQLLDEASWKWSTPVIVDSTTTYGIVSIAAP